MSANPAPNAAFHHGPQRHVPEVRHLRHDGVFVNLAVCTDLVPCRNTHIARYSDLVPSFGTGGHPYRI
jgi:hypothetical protein